LGVFPKAEVSGGIRGALVEPFILGGGGGEGYVDGVPDGCGLAFGRGYVEVFFVLADGQPDPGRVSGGQRMASYFDESSVWRVEDGVTGSVYFDWKGGQALRVGMAAIGKGKQKEYKKV
jgi:hypothetical protein